MWDDFLHRLYFLQEGGVGQGHACVFHTVHVWQLVVKAGSRCLSMRKVLKQESAHLNVDHCASNLCESSHLNLHVKQLPQCDARELLGA